MILSHQSDYGWNELFKQVKVLLFDFSDRENPVASYVSANNLFHDIMLFL